MKISEALKEAGSHQTTTKGQMVSNPSNPSPNLMTMTGNPQETYMQKLTQMPYLDFSNELSDLYDLGMTDLNSNLRAISLA